MKKEFQTLLSTHSNLADQKSVDRLTIKLAPDNMFALHNMGNIDFETKTEEENLCFQTC